MTDDLAEGLDEWNHSNRSSIEYITHDSGTAQFEINYDGTEGSYRIRFKFEGGTDFVEIRAYDTRQTDIREDAKTAVMGIIDRFEDEIDEQYYTQDPSDVELHRIDDGK